MCSESSTEYTNWSSPATFQLAKGVKNGCHASCCSMQCGKFHSLWLLAAKMYLRSHTWIIHTSRKLSQCRVQIYSARKPLMHLVDILARNMDKDSGLGVIRRTGCIAISIESFWMKLIFVDTVSISFKRQIYGLKLQSLQIYSNAVGRLNSIYSFKVFGFEAL